MNSPLRLVPWVHAQETSISIALIYQSALDNSLTAQPLTLEGLYRSDRNFDNHGLQEVELGISAPNEKSLTYEAARLAKKSTVEFSSKVSALRQALGLLPE